MAAREGGKREAVMADYVQKSFALSCRVKLNYFKIKTCRRLTEDVVKGGRLERCNLKRENANF